MFSIPQFVHPNEVREDVTFLFAAWLLIFAVLIFFTAGLLFRALGASLGAYRIPFSETGLLIPSG